MHTIALLSVLTLTCTLFKSLCHQTKVLEHAVGVFETCSEILSDTVCAVLNEKLDFNCKAVLRLACNMVTEAKTGSTI